MKALISLCFLLLVACGQNDKKHETVVPNTPAPVDEFSWSTFNSDLTISANSSFSVSGVLNRNGVIDDQVRTATIEILANETLSKSVEVTVENGQLNTFVSSSGLAENATYQIRVVFQGVSSELIQVYVFGMINPPGGGFPPGGPL